MTLSKHEGIYRLNDLVNQPKQDRQGLLNISRATLYGWMKAGHFPKPTLKLGPSLVAWKKQDVHAWLESREV